MRIIIRKKIILKNVFETEIRWTLLVTTTIILVTSRVLLY